MTTAAEDLLVRIDATTEQLRREMRRGDQEVTRSTGKINRQLRTVDQQFGQLNKTVRIATKALGAVGLALSFRAVSRYASSLIEAADATGKAAETANIASESLQELRFAFGQLADVTDREVDVSLQRFNRRLGLAVEGSGAAKQAFDSMFGGADQFESTEQALDSVMDRLANMEDGARRAAMASQFFGEEAGPKIAQALGQGSEAVRGLRQDARDLGIVLDQDMLDNAAQIRDEFDKSQRILSTSMMRALTNLTPLLVKLADLTASVATGIGEIFATDEQAARKQLARLQERLAADEALLQAGVDRSGRALSDAITARIEQRVSALRGVIQNLEAEVAGFSGSGSRIGTNENPVEVKGGSPIQSMLDDLDRQAKQQTRLNEALRESEDRHEGVTAAIDRENAARKVGEELKNSDGANVEALTEDYLEYYDALQQAKTAFDDLVQSQALLQELRDAYDPAAVEREKHEERMAALEEIDAELFESIEERNAIIREIERDHQQRLRDIQAEGQGSTLSGYLSFLTQLESAQGKSLAAQVGIYSDAFAQISAAGAQHNREMFELNKAAGIVNAIIATQQGAAEALKLGWPLGHIAAATIVAAGLSRVSAIASTSFQGGGRGAAPSVSGSTPATPVTPVGSTRPQAAQDINIRLRGSNQDMDAVADAVIGAIQERVDDGLVIGNIRRI